jgi:hypothetical protein
MRTRTWLDAAPLSALHGDDGVDDDRMQFVPLCSPKPGA